jgi:hypothetical protein
MEVRTLEGTVPLKGADDINIASVPIEHAYSVSARRVARLFGGYEMRQSRFLARIYLLRNVHVECAGSRGVKGEKTRALIGRLDLLNGHSTIGAHRFDLRVCGVQESQVKRRSVYTARFLPGGIGRSPLVVILH